MSVEIDMDKVAADTVQQLGTQNARMLMELNATRAAVAALEARATELTGEVERLSALVPQEADKGTGKIDPAGA